MRACIQSMTLAMLVVILFLFPLNSANALVGTLLGIGGGSLLIDDAADEMDDVIARAEQAGQALISLADDKARDRLDQIDKIVDDALSDISKITVDFEARALGVIKEATAELRFLEDKLMTDLSQRIFEVECGARVWALEDARIALGEMADFLDTHRLTVTPPVKVDAAKDIDQRISTDILKIICIWCEKEAPENVFKIETPFVNTYTAVKDYMLKQIDDNITPDTPSFSISHTYDFIATFAKKAQCFEATRNGGTSDEYIEYLHKANSYNKLLDIEVTFSK